jgi:hypothetical protein
MKQYYSHNSRNWQMERMSTLSLGYCFNNVAIDIQGKPNTKSRVT